MVRLTFALPSPARVSFLIVGPAPSCTLAGRFVIAGHRGVNKVLFRGRVRGHLLRWGVYKIVPSRKGLGPRSLRPFGIVVDARGVHPAARVPDERCGAQAKAGPAVRTESPTSGNSAGIGRGGVAAEMATKRGVLASVHSADPLAERHGRNAPIVGFASGKDSALTVLLLLFVIVSVMLIWLSAVEPGYATTRFRVVRALAAHREQVAVFGALSLVAAGVLFLIARLP
jgi:hypothetical protein